MAQGINKQVIETKNQYLSIQWKNNTGSSLSVWSVVYITGSQWWNVTFALADKDTEATSSKTFGLLSKNVWVNGFVNIVTKGKYKFNGLDTSAFTEWGALWLGDSGWLVQAPPAEPAHSVFIGWLEIKGTNSTIIVDIQNWYELGELHGVEITNVQDWQVLQYNASTELWENKNSTGWWVSEELVIAYSIAL